MSTEIGSTPETETSLRHAEDLEEPDEGPYKKNDQKRSSEEVVDDMGGDGTEMEEQVAKKQRLSKTGINDKHQIGLEGKEPNDAITDQTHAPKDVPGAEVTNSMEEDVQQGVEDNGYDAPEEATTREQVMKNGPQNDATSGGSHSCSVQDEKQSRNMDDSSQQPRNIIVEEKSEKCEIDESSRQEKRTEQFIEMEDDQDAATPATDSVGEQNTKNISVSTGIAENSDAPRNNTQVENEGDKQNGDKAGDSLLLEEEEGHKSNSASANRIAQDGKVAAHLDEESEKKELDPSQQKQQDKQENFATQNCVHISTSADGKPNKKHARSKDIDPRVLSIRRRIQLGCRDNDLAQAIQAYEEAITEDVPMEAQSYYNLLNLCGGLDKNNIHIGTPKVSSGQSNQADGGSRLDGPPDDMFDLKQRLDYAFKIKDRMAQQKLALNETAYSAIVKLLSRNKEFELAENVLDEAEKVQQCKPKLRLYSSILAAYCEESRMLDALKIWKRLKGKLELSEREHLCLMKCAISTGDSLVFQQALSYLAEVVSVPSKDTVAALIEWFEITHSQHTESLTKRQADSSLVKEILSEINNVSGDPSTSEPPPSMGPVVNTKGWVISSACHIDVSDGRLMEGCLKGAQLKPVQLSERAFQVMLDNNEEIIMKGKISGNDSEFQGGRKGKQRNDFSPESRKDHWRQFLHFLETNVKDAPFDVVIDGANVGYFNQNFQSAPRHVDYEQIDWIVRYFRESKNQKALLVMHSRHFSSGLMPPQFKSLCQAWERDGILYKTPPGMNDDWFWMHVALKYKTLVVTNDEMRDHHFQMLAPRFFLRWKERHQVHFEFGAWENNSTSNSGQQKEVILSYPAVYSRRIQRVADGLVIPLAKRGDENRFLDGSHVACDDEPVEETYLCIRPRVAVEEPGGN